MRSFILLGAAATLLLASDVYAQPYPWHASLLSGDTTSNVRWGRVRFHPTSANTIWATRANFPDPLAAAPDPGDGLWGTTNGGNTWSRVNSGDLTDDLNVLDFAWCENDPNIAYAATQVAGVIKTTDGGATWVAVNNGITYNGDVLPNDQWGATTIAIDPDDCDKVYTNIAQLAGLDIFNPSPDHPGFFYSHDGGANWTTNNDGLPPRSDSILDGVSNTSTIQSMIVAKDAGVATIYAAMVQIEFNTKIIGAQKATAQTKVFSNAADGTGTWTDMSTGLPEVSQIYKTGSLTRVAAAGSFITAFETGPTTAPALFLGHFGQGINQYTLSDETKAKSQGVWLIAPDHGVPMWIARNTGLPVVDDDNNKNSINVTNVAVIPGSPYPTLLVGVMDSESAMPNSSQVWASQDAGGSWLPGASWSTGLSDSPSGLYNIANPNFVAVAPNYARVAATVSWDDGTGLDFTDDDGVYLLP